MTLPTDWQTERPWRDANPGDLRCLPNGETWEGQTGVDPTDGGYCVYGTAAAGWRALYVTLRSYQTEDGCHTIEAIADRWAPPADDNDTSAYTAGLVEMTGIAATQVLDASDRPTYRLIGHAISVMEGGDLPWTEADQAAGLAMAFAA